MGLMLRMLGPLFCLCLLLGTSLVALGSVAAWFLYPRRASVELSEFKVAELFVTPPQNLTGDSLPDYRFLGDAVVLVHNPNYASIYLDELNMDVRWSETVLGKVSTTEKEFPGRRNQTIDIPIEVSSDSAPVSLPQDVLLRLAHALLTGQSLTLSFEGTADVNYLGVQVKIPVQFEHEIDTTGLIPIDD